VKTFYRNDTVNIKRAIVDRYVLTYCKVVLHHISA